MRAVAVVWLLFERNEAESSYPRSAHPARSREEILIFEFVVPPVCGLENLPTNKIFLPSTGGFINRKTVELGRAEGIERVEDPGPEPPNLRWENFFGRKIFRRLTRPLAATLQAVAVS